MRSRSFRFRTANIIFPTLAKPVCLALFLAVIISALLGEASAEGALGFRTTLHKRHSSPTDQTADAKFPAVYAFAKASPLTVFDTPELNNGRKENFEFARAYEVSEETSGAIRLKLSDSKLVYVRSAHLTITRTPLWLTTTPGYETRERARIRFWESGVRISQFLAGIHTAGAQWDYEEYFDTTPNYSLSLPIIETDSLELLGGSRQVKIASVMMPISKAMYQKFEEARSNNVNGFDLHLIVDVSGSARGFLEAAVTDLLKSLKSWQVEDRIGSVTVTVFGESHLKKSSFKGKMSLKELATFKWFEAGVEQSTSSEREPLIDGLVTMQTKVKMDKSKIPVLIVLSGADVELSSYIKNERKQISIENWEHKFPPETVVIFTQITPEPSDELRSVSDRFRNVSHVRYIDYSERVGESIVSELSSVLDAPKNTPLDPKLFTSVAAVAQKARMMAFLPRVLTVAAGLPAPESYEKECEWYTVRLFVTLDELLWKQTMQ